jgi:hypothetical protein
MAGSNVYMNWKSVTVTFGTVPTVVSLTEVMDVQVLDQEGLEPWQADGHKFPTLLIAATGSRGMTIVGGSVNKLAAIPRNTPCTVVAILNDAVNGAGAGAITHTLVNAVLADAGRSGPSNKFAGGTATFVAFSPDGITDPLTIAIAT